MQWTEDTLFKEQYADKQILQLHPYL